MVRPFVWKWGPWGRLPPDQITSLVGISRLSIKHTLFSFFFSSHLTRDKKSLFLQREKIGMGEKSHKKVKSSLFSWATALSSRQGFCTPLIKIYQNFLVEFSFKMFPVENNCGKLNGIASSPEEGATERFPRLHNPAPGQMTTFEFESKIVGRIKVYSRRILAHIDESRIVSCGGILADELR